jgi:hypothetical protein
MPKGKLKFQKTFNLLQILLRKVGILKFEIYGFHLTFRF